MTEHSIGGPGQHGPDGKIAQMTPAWIMKCTELLAAPTQGRLLCQNNNQPAGPQLPSSSPPPPPQCPDLRRGKLLHAVKYAQLDPVGVCKEDRLGAALLAAACVRVLVTLPSNVGQVGRSGVRPQDLPIKARILQENL